MEAGRFQNIEEIIEKYRENNLLAKRGQNVQLFVNDQKPYYTEILSRQDCEQILMEREVGAFFVRRVEVGEFVSLRAKFNHSF